MSINSANIVTAFGAYYIPEGQNMDRLREQLRQPSVTPSYAIPIIHDGDVYRFSNVTLGQIVQGFQKGFTPKGDLTFEPNEIRLRNIKIDLSLFPDDVKGRWLGFLAGLPNDMERKNWPIVKYLMEKHVATQIGHDMELQAYFNGSYVAPTPGTPSAASAVLDGVKKLLDAGITGSTMQAVTLSSVITETNAFDRIEQFVDNFDPLLSSVPVTVYMSTKMLKWYLRDKRNTHGTDVNYVAGKVTVDFAENVKLVGLPSMGNSGYVWATPDDNFLYLRKANGMSDPKIEEAKREVNIMLDWWEGLGFGYNALVYVYKPGQEEE